MFLDNRRLDCAKDDLGELLEAEIAKGATVDAQVKYARTAALNTIPRAGRFSGRPSQVCSRGIWNLQGIHRNQYGREGGANLRLPFLRRHKDLTTSAGEWREGIRLFVDRSQSGDVMNLRSRRGRSEPHKNKFGIGPA
jgi:hypothetical protein